MSRFFVSPEKVKKDKIIVDGSEAHHILTVMRLKENDPVVVFDGTGKQYEGFISSSDRKKKTLVIEVIKTEKPLANTLPEITLAQAIPKKDKMKYILEKSTELGISAIIPIITERTIVRPEGFSTQKIQRWKRIVTSASKQCGRVSVPEIQNPAYLKDIINNVSEYDMCIVASLHGKTVPLKNVFENTKPRRILVFIGPEGGFTPDEVKLCNDNFKFVSLGKNVLKSDTAGLFVLSAVNYEYS